MTALTTNIFIIHSPLQHLLVSHMVSEMTEFRERDNYLVLDMPSDQITLKKEIWTDIVYLDPPVGRYFIGSGANCRRSIRYIEELKSPFENAALFVSDIEWPLNNAVYGLKQKHRDKNILICNFPDGAGSLMVRYPRFKRKIRSLIKFLIGMAGGLPYTFYSGDIMGLEACDRVYSLMPKLLPDDINSNMIEIPKFRIEEENFLPDSCLFLGQTYEYHFPPEEHREFCTKTADYIKSLGYRHNYYKPHFFAKTETEKNIFLERGFELIEDSRPVEEIFLSRQMSCIASYNSSALVHLKLMFGDKIRSISCFNNWSNKYTITGKTSFESARRLFEACGVEMFEQD